jgi:3-hydroxybutyryl-CoA dehydrogenase
MVDRMAPPHTILVTPTANHSIADLASCTYRSERCFSFEVPDGFIAGAAPVALLRLVQTHETLPEVREQVLAFWATTGWPAAVHVDPAHTPSPTIR